MEHVQSDADHLTMASLARSIAFWPQARSEDGASLVEYALLLALIAVVAVAAIAYFGTALNSSYSNIGSKVAGS